MIITDIRDITKEKHSRSIKREKKLIEVYGLKGYKKVSKYFKEALYHYQYIRIIKFYLMFEGKESWIELWYDLNNNITVIQPSDSYQFISMNKIEKFGEKYLDLIVNGIPIDKILEIDSNQTIEYQPKEDISKENEDLFVKILKLLS